MAIARLAIAWESVRAMGQNDFLNFVRWVAASLVALGHLRDLLLLDYDQIGQVGVAVRGFYFITGFTHEAVIVFFVLSGFLVGGRVAEKVAAGSFAPRSYFIDRFSRIYIVIGPSLLMTAMFVYVLLEYLAGTAIVSASNGWSHMLSFEIRDRVDFRTFACNLALVHTIICEPYAMNGPLWSLANEWFYYLTFPVMFIAAARIVTNKWARHAAVIVAALLLSFIPGLSSIAVYFPIWLIGVIAHDIYVNRNLGFMVPALSSVVLVAAMCLARFRVGELLVTDYAVALGVAGMISAKSLGRVRVFSRSNAFLADFSYSLYVNHVPVFVMVIACLQGYFGWSERLRPDAVGMTAFVLLAIFGWAAALAFAGMTEKQTPKLRAFLHGLGKSPAG